jgi:hypothetical protein
VGVRGHVTPRPRFTPGEWTHCTGGWVGPRADLDTEDRGKILCPCRGSNPDHPIVQPVVRHYTAWANPAPTVSHYSIKLFQQSPPHTHTHAHKIGDSLQLWTDDNSVAINNFKYFFYRSPLVVSSSAFRAWWYRDPATLGARQQRPSRLKTLYELYKPKTTVTTCTPQTNVVGKTHS